MTAAILFLCVNAADFQTCTPLQFFPSADACYTAARAFEAQAIVRLPAGYICLSARG
jgi:hypothetical protein